MKSAILLVFFLFYFRDSCPEQKTVCFFQVRT